MSTLSNKIDFAVVMTVRKANPNGDPLNGNRPREDFDGFGEISDVCIKRKLRNRLQDMGERIFVQSSDRCDDGAKSLHDRASNTESLKKAGKDSVKFAAAACAEWIDVRAFGQVFAFKGDSVSIGVRGPVSIRTAETITPIDISTMQITKSVNGETKDTKASDTMGSKNRVEFGLYVCYGSINPQLAEKTGFSEEDAQKIIAKRAEEQQEYLAGFQKEKGVKVLDNGAMIKLSRAGSGKTPKADSTVTVHYTGTLLDGTKFDSSRDRNKPFQTKLTDVIPCWTKGMQQMKPGARAQLVCPPQTAYGNRPVGPIPPNSVLVFDVEMISVDK